MRPLHPDVERARKFALSSHGSQTYGKHPYIFHLDMVAAILAPYGVEAQVLGYLHDVKEDNPSISLSVIREQFGARVAGDVAILTDELGRNRKERKAKTYAKMSRVGVEGYNALLVKTADRLANRRCCIADGNTVKGDMYGEEHDDFRAACYRAGLCDHLWEEMGALQSNWLSQKCVMDNSQSTIKP